MAKLTEFTSASEHVWMYDDLQSVGIALSSEERVADLHQQS